MLEYRVTIFCDLENSMNENVDSVKGAIYEGVYYNYIKPLIFGFSHIFTLILSRFMLWNKGYCKW